MATASPQHKVQATGSGTPEDKSKDDSDFSLGQTAEALYQREATRRDTVIERAREVAQVTIPSLVPPEGYQEGDKLYTPHQGVGARGINNISSRLMMTLMPPERPLFKHEIPEDLITDWEQEDPEVYGKVVLAMAKRSLRVTARADTTPLRAVTRQVFRLLGVAGNCLFRYRNVDSPAVAGMDRYIVKRDNEGNPLLTIYEEHVAWNSLTKQAQELASKDTHKAILDKPAWERAVPVYTVCKLAKRASQMVWLSWQEVFGKKVKDSEEVSPFNAPPQYPLWMVPSYGHDWGRAYADEYIGDLISCENYSKSLNDGAAAAALALLFVRPGSRTRLDQVKKAKNLDVMAGDANDLSMFRTDKQGDFRFVLEVLKVVEERLAFAFVLNSAIQRSGERVTAEEIRIMSRELNEAMGGLYAVLAHSVQGYIVNRLLYLLESTGELTKIPTMDGKDRTVRVKIVTGVDALGSSREVELLDEFMAPFFQLGEAGLRRINMDEYGRRKAAALGINPQGLVRTSEDLAAEEQQAKQEAMQRAVIEKGVGPAVSAVGKAAPELLTQGGADPASLAQLLPGAGQPQ